jgi:nucleoside-diphosphate-sugar epimerase
MEQRNPLILITGGAGYIGSVLAELLLQHGHRVRIADQLLFGRAGLDSLGTHSNLEFLQGDLRDAAFAEKATDGVQIVVHLAAIVGDEACRKFSVLAHETNTVASEQLWNQSRKSGVAHFIFASTCSNYGIMADELNLLHEDSPLNPVSDYALQKTGFEKFLLS